MKAKKKKGRTYVSKSDLAEFFLFYEERYFKLKKLFYFSLSLGLVFLITIPGSNLYFYLADLLLPVILIITLLVLSSKKTIKIWKIDPDAIDQFISFFETPGEKRKKSFKSLIEKLEIAQNKFNSYNSFMLKSNLVIFLIVFSILVPLLLTTIWPIQIFIIFQVMLVFTKIGVSLLLIFIFNRTLIYKNVEKCSNLFKVYIDTKLADIEYKIREIIQTTNNRLLINKLDLKEKLRKWYDFFCSRFSESKDVNDIFNLYENLIFDIQEMDFYIELFLDLKGRIIDYKHFLLESLKDKDKKDKLDDLGDILGLLENYINILNNNLKIIRQRKQEIREKRKNIQTWIYIVIAPLSLIISIFINVIMS